MRMWVWERDRVRGRDRRWGWERWGRKGRREEGEGRRRREGDRHTCSYISPQVPSKSPTEADQNQPCHTSRSGHLGLGFFGSSPIPDPLDFWFTKGWWRPCVSRKKFFFFSCESSIVSLKIWFLVPKVLIGEHLVMVLVVVVVIVQVIHKKCLPPFFMFSQRKTNFDIFFRGNQTSGFLFGIQTHTTITGAIS